jgi:hypothetical protein
MNRGTARFLQLVIVLIGIGALAVLLWEPTIEGRNAHATLYQVYFTDPFLAYAYIAAIPFFIGVIQAFHLAGYAGRKQLFSPAAVQSLRNIRYCALAVAAFVLGGEAWLVLVQRGKDDIAGGVAIGLFLILASAIVAAAAGLLRRMLQERAGLRSM